MLLEKVVAFQWEYQPIAYHRVVKIPHPAARSTRTGCVGVLRCEACSGKPTPPLGKRGQRGCSLIIQIHIRYAVNTDGKVIEMTQYA